MKKFNIILILLASFTLFAVASIPKTLSTKPGLFVLSKILSNSLSTDISIEEASFSWNGPQLFKRVVCNSCNNHIIVDSITTDSSFLNVFLSKKFIQLDVRGRAGSYGSFILQSSYLDLKNLFLAKNIKLQGNQLPTHFVDSFYKEIPFLNDAVGNTFNISLNENSGRYLLNFESSLLNLSGIINFDETSNFEIGPLKINSKKIAQLGNGLFSGNLDLTSKVSKEKDCLLVQGEITSDNFSLFPLSFVTKLPNSASKTKDIWFSANIDKPELMLAANGVISSMEENYISSLDAQAKFKNLPLISHVSQDWAKFIGKNNSLDLAMNYVGGKKAGGKLDLFLNGDNISAQANLLLDSQLRLQSKDKQILVKAQLPASQAQLLFLNTPLHELQWTHPVPISLKVDDLNLSRSLWQKKPHGHVSTAFEEQGISATFSIGPIEAIFPSSHKKFIMGLLEGSITTLPGGKTVNLSLASKNSKMTFQLNGTLGLTESRNADIKVEGSAIPTPLVSLILGLKNPLAGSFEDVVGNEMSLKCYLNSENGNGKVILSASSPTAKIHMDGGIKNGNLYLLKPFELQATLTPLVIRNLTVPFPFLNGLVLSDKPIELMVEPNGFSMMYQSFDLKNASIQKGTLSLGNLLFQETSELGILLKGLGFSNGNRHILIKSTPIYFSMAHGLITLDRWDILVAEKFPLALWGSIQIIKQKINMILGLTPRALEVAFKASGLPSNQLLQIPIKGTFGNISIDKRALAAKIGSLMAQSDNSPGGLLVGTFLQLTTNPGDEAPSATTHPLPWDIQ